MHMNIPKRLKSTVLCFVVIVVMLLGGCSSERISLFDAIRIKSGQIAQVKINGEILDEERRDSLISLLSRLELKEIYKFTNILEQPSKVLLSIAMNSITNDWFYDVRVTSEGRLVVRDTYYEANKEAVKQILDLYGKSEGSIQSVFSEPFLEEIVSFHVRDKECDELLSMLELTCGRLLFQYECAFEMPEGALQITIRDSYGKTHKWSKISDDRVILGDGLYISNPQETEKLLEYLRDLYRTQQE